LILVDANLLLYAYDSDSAHHRTSKDWWEKVLNGHVPVWLCWPTVLAFIRISTNSRLLASPLSIEDASEIVDSWLARRVVQWREPGTHHWSVLKQTLKDGQIAGPLVTDAHLAALAIEHGAVLYSADRDFARFPELRWVNPLE